MKKTAKKTGTSSSALKSQFDTTRLNQVTSFSKVTAAVLFVALPFLAFVLGLMYQHSYNLIGY
jgi:hypothetical protein